MPFGSSLARRLTGVAAFIALALGATAALAQSPAQWPDRAVRLLVPVGYAHPIFWAPFSVVGDGG